MQTHTKQVESESINVELCNQVIKNVSRVVVGNHLSLKLIMVALLAEGHVLIEDVPGVGKTLLAKTLAKSIGGTFKRVQFTPDLLPSDITGFNIYNQQTSEFSFQSGPVMSNVLLADEINRTVPRTQASMLESMEENQITVDGKSLPLPRPFFVMATQNPIELEGTFPLPEAQLDRFLIKIDLGYPDFNEEMTILERFQSGNPLFELESITQPEHITDLQSIRRKIRVTAPVKKYIIQIAHATRQHPSVKFGTSPRGSMALMRAAQGLAAIEGRDYTLPDDVKALVIPVLTHRLVLKDHERLKGETPHNVIAQIIDQISVPTPIA